MAHFPKPFFKKSRRVWYVEINRQQHNLGPDKDEAFRKYHQLMAQPGTRSVSSGTVPPLVDSFLDWVKRENAPDTFEWYRYRLERFCQRYPDLKLRDLKPYHVQQ